MSTHHGGEISPMEYSVQFSEDSHEQSKDIFLPFDDTRRNRFEL
jgi:hypothetical protein